MASTISPISFVRDQPGLDPELNPSPDGTNGTTGDDSNS
jgi:hypothetical protein